MGSKTCSAEEGEEASAYDKRLWLPLVSHHSNRREVVNVLREVVDLRESRISEGPSYELMFVHGIASPSPKDSRTVVTELLCCRNEATNIAIADVAQDADEYD